MIKDLQDVEKLFAQKKDIAPKQLPKFEGLNARLSESIGEREQAVVKDSDGNYYSVKVIDGKLFRGTALTEVT